jgi:hypothetical protein
VGALCHQLRHHPPLIQGGFVPDHLGQHILQLLLFRDRHDVGQRVTILGGMLGQLHGQIPLHRHLAFPTPK